MIEFVAYEKVDGTPDCEFWFTRKDLPKLITVFERALNTLSPMDPELLKVLEDMKEVK